MKSFLIIILFLFSITTTHSQTWQWGAQFGGLSTGPNNANPDESIRDVIIDNQGNVYFCGTVRQPSTANGNVIATYGAYDIVVGKMNCHGDLVWLKTAGGFFNDFANTIYQDNAGNLYLSGHIDATSNNPCNLFGMMVVDNTQDLFLTKMDTAGNVLWSKVAGAGFQELGTDAFHLKGGINNTIDMLFRVTIDGELFPGDSVTRGWWLATLDTSGAILSKFQFTPYLNPFPVFDFANGPNGDRYYIATFGQGWDSASIGGQMIYRINPGGDDLVFFKFNSANNLEWLHQIGDTTFRYIEGNKIMVSSNDEVYIGGSIFNGYVFGNDTMFNTIGGSNMNFPFLAKYNNQGVAQWGINMSSTFSCEMSGGMTELPNGNIAFSGYFINTGQIDTFHVVGSGQEIFIGEITPSRSLLSVTTFPSGLRDYPQALTSDSAGNIYLGGAFSDTFTMNGISYTYEGGKTDGFVAKYGYICTTGIDEILSNATSVAIFPNPARDLINIRTSLEEQVTVILINTLGERVYEKNISANESQQITLNVQKLPPGIYFVQLQTKKGMISGKFVKVE